MYLSLNMKNIHRSLGAPSLPQTPEISLDAAGLVALADLTTIQKRTALMGTANFLDCLVICPGIHMQQSSPNLNGGEYPACSALTTGYVFRVENPATVFYLQQVGRTGQLTNMRVSEVKEMGKWYNIISFLFPSPRESLLSALVYGLAVSWALAVIVLLGVYNDWWGFSVVLMLVASRLCNVIIIRRRARPGWFGAPEPGVDGDLLVLLSQDRWVRIQGKVDHLKAVTSGQWLRDQETLESWATAVATLVVYLAAALVSNATLFGQILIVALFAGSVGLLAIANSATKSLMMHGYDLHVVGERKAYRRRRELADELIRETKRDDWAVRMGMVAKKTNPGEMAEEETVTM